MNLITKKETNGKKDSNGNRKMRAITKAKDKLQKKMKKTKDTKTRKPSGSSEEMTKEDKKLARAPKHITRRCSRRTF